jgi:hypothetical protein
MAAASRELTLAREALRFLARRDSLLAALGDSAGTVRLAAPDVPPAWTAWLSQSTDRPAAVADSARVLAAVFMDTTDWRHRAPERVRWGGWSNSTVTALGAAAAPFACVAIHDIRARPWRTDLRVLLDPDRFPTRNPLGVCRFVAAHGAPGAGVHAWLAAGGWELGATDGASHRGAFVTDRGLREALSYFVADGAYALASCFEGSAPGCRRWFLRDTGGSAVDRQGSSPLGHGAFVSAWWGSGFGGLLADLEEEMGPEGFRAFWTSALPVDSAFAGAFGQDVGVWTGHWMERRFGPLPRQGPRGGDYATTAVVAGLLVALAAAAGHRRQVR